MGRRGKDGRGSGKGRGGGGRNDRMSSNRHRKNEVKLSQTVAASSE